MTAIVFYFNRNLSSGYFELPTVEAALRCIEELHQDRLSWDSWELRPGRVPMPKLITGKFLVEDCWKS